MVKQILQYGKGHVRIRVEGGSYERFLNLCANHNIYLWDLIPSGDAYEMNLSIKEFRELKPLAKKSRVRVRVVERYGLPFFLHRYRNRKLFFAGIMAALGIILFLSCFIWDIHVEGNLHETTEVILEYLKTEEIGHGTWKSGIDCKALASSLRKQFDDFIWVSVKIDGTRLLIDVQENTDLALEDDRVYEDSDLISNVDGTIVKMVTRTGAPEVAAGDEIKKGDMLVRGRLEILDDAGEVSTYRYCAADADIYVKTVYHYKSEFPLTYKDKVYTGNQQNGYFFTAFGKRFTFALGAGGYELKDTVTLEHQAQLWENFFLPVSWGKIEVKEYENQQKTYTNEEAAKKAGDELSYFLKKIQEKGVQIFENNVKIETSAKTCKAEGDIYLIEKAGKRVAAERVDAPQEKGTDEE